MYLSIRCPLTVKTTKSEGGVFMYGVGDSVFYDVPLLSEKPRHKVSCDFCGTDLTNHFYVHTITIQNSSSNQGDEKNVCSDCKSGRTDSDTT